MEKLDELNILEEGFEFFQTNKFRSWYKKFSPEVEGNWYGYKMYWCILIHDPEMELLKICIDFSGDAGEDYEEMDTVFEGWCPDIESFYKILKLIRLK